MFFEKRWAPVPVKFLTANGTDKGVLTVADTRSLRVKQLIILKSNTQPTRSLQVKRVTSSTTIEVGLPDFPIDQREDVSAYTVVDGASFFANQQPRPAIGQEDYERAVFDEEPIVAKRVILVDELGEYRNDNNPSPVLMEFIRNGVAQKIVEDVATPANNRPLPVKLTGVQGDVNISAPNINLEVQLEGEYNAVSNPLPDSVGLVSHARGATQDRTKQLQRITAKRGTTDTDTVSQDVSLHDENGNKYSAANPLQVADDAARTSLTSIDSKVATEAKQDVGNASLSSIDGKVSTAVKQDVGNASLASIDSKLSTTNTTLSSIDTKVSTAAKQDIGNASLSSIDSKVSTAAKQDVGNASLSSMDGKLSTLIAQTDNVESQLATLITQTDTVESLLSSIDAGIPASLGQTTMPNCMPVVVASDQSPIKVKQGAVVSSANSSNALLAGGAAFTGVFEEILDYSMISVLITSNVASATDGLEIQWSYDGVTVTDTDVFSILAGAKKQFTFGTPAKYFRVKYTNGATPQGSFILQVIYHSMMIKPSSHRLIDAIIDDDDAELVKAVIAAKRLDGTYGNLIADNQGRIFVSPSSIGANTAIRQTVVVAAGVTNFLNYTVPVSKTLEIDTFYGGGEKTGRYTLYRHDPAAASTILNGSFESGAEVAAWAAVTGTFTAPSPDSNSTQVHGGAASMRWIYTNSATQLERKQTFGTPQDFTTHRYISAWFYNDAAAGTTRIIRIILASGASTRTYELSGTLGVAPFLANTWINILGDLENPTASTGASFDLRAVTAISVFMDDGANKAGTVYWDQIELVDSLTVLHRLYAGADATQVLNLANAETLTAGQNLYLATKNIGTTSGEFTITASGVLI